MLLADRRSGRNCTEEGGSPKKQPPIAHRKCAVKHMLLRATIQIAPTEFPKTRSAVESLTGVAARNKPTAYTSQEEEAHADSTRKRG